MPDIDIPIGSLRWPVIIARRPQSFDPPGGVGIYEDLIAVQTIRCNIFSVNDLTFFGAEQVGTPVTHRIFARWLDYLDNTNVIIRSTYRTDKSVRTEIFRIRRIREINGRKRFVDIGVELEKTLFSAPGSAQ